MDDDDIDEIAPFEGSPWSWPSFLAETFIAIASIVEAISAFADSVSVQFMRMHNLFVDDCNRKSDGVKFAQDVLSGLDKLD